MLHFPFLGKSSPQMRCEDRVVAVLDGQVEIRQDLLVPLHGGDEVVGDALRV